MDATKSHIKIYNISEENAEDFEFEYSVNDSDLLSELVPHQEDWGNLSWGIEFEEYEYNLHDNAMHLTLNTKWEAPIEWLQNASKDNRYFENRLITMSTIQKDETSVTCVAVMDGEVLQNKTVWSMSSEEVGKYYDDDCPTYELDDLDNLIWDSIGKFMEVCEKFYLEKEENK